MARQAKHAGSLIDRLMTIVLAMATVVLVAVLLIRQRVEPARTTLETPVESSVGWLDKPFFIDGWDRALANGIRVGEATAPVQIIEFIDFECPACLQFYEVGLALRKQYSGKEVAFTFLHYPLPYHLHAQSAARAAECADELGRFEDFHEQTFEAQHLLGKQPWSWFARAAGVRNPMEFQACVDGDRSFPRISAGLIEGERFGVKGTPTVVINGFSYGTAVPDVEELDERVRAILAGGRPFHLPDSGPSKPTQEEEVDRALLSPDDSTCPDCAIQFDVVMTVGSLDGPDWFPEEPRSMARDSRGRLYLAFPMLGQLPLFDSKGQPLPPIGRGGEGPGEYQLPYLVRVGLSDTVMIVDGTHQLSSVNPSGGFLGRSRVPVQAEDFLVTGDGTLIFSGHPLAPFDEDVAGRRLHVFDPDHAIIERSFHPALFMNLLMEGSLGG